MKTTTTKKNFIDTLKYGKSYILIKVPVDNLCKAVTKIGGKYSIKYIEKDSLFVVYVSIPKWISIPEYAVDYGNTDISLFIIAHRFAATYLNHVENLYWKKDCHGHGRVEYRISHRYNQVFV